MESLTKVIFPVVHLKKRSWSGGITAGRKHKGGEIEDKRREELEKTKRM